LTIGVGEGNGKGAIGLIGIGIGRIGVGRIGVGRIGVGRIGVGIIGAGLATATRGGVGEATGFDLPINAGAVIALAGESDITCAASGVDATDAVRIERRNLVFITGKRYSYWIKLARIFFNFYFLTIQEVCQL
jgi:hypothetical protein